MTSFIQFHCFCLGFSISLCKVSIQLSVNERCNSGCVFTEKQGYLRLVGCYANSREVLYLSVQSGLLEPNASNKRNYFLRRLVLLNGVSPNGGCHICTTREAVNNWKHLLQTIMCVYNNTGNFHFRKITIIVQQ